MYDQDLPDIGPHDRRKAERVDVFRLLAGQYAQGRNRRRLARDWALVLAARGVEHDLAGTPGNPALLVPARYKDAAVSEITSYEQENTGEPVLPAPDFIPNTEKTVWVLMLIAFFHALTTSETGFLGYAPHLWTEAGSAAAGKILDGQWWRLVTALSLHGDEAHLLGNLLLGGVFIVLVARELGQGLGWLLIILAGVSGNLVNALVRSPSHASIGFSTSVFGAVGILTGLRMIRGKGLRYRQAGSALAAALALFGLLGVSGGDTDVGAHLFGLVCGLVLGTGAGLWAEFYGVPGKTANRAMIALDLGLPVFAWYLAFHAA